MKRLTNILMVLALTMIFFETYLLAEDSKGGLMKRDEIDAKYKWNLTDLYPSDDLWEVDFKSVESQVDKYKSLEGKIGASAESLMNFLRLDEETGMKAEKLRTYASLAKDLDLSDTKYQAMYERITNLYNKLETASSYFRPELLEIPNEKLTSWINSYPGMKMYQQFIDNIVRFKPHTLPKDQEKLMALSSPVEESFSNTYRLYSNVDIKFPSVPDEKGETIQLSHARYYTAMYSTDRDFRERAYKAIYVPFVDNINFLTANYVGSIKAKIFNAKARSYKNTLEAALDQNNIPVEVYHNLIKTVNENLGPMHRWCALKKKLLKLDNMHAYDTYVTLFPSVKKEYSPDKAMQICLEACKPLGDDYVKNLKFAFDNRWIDFFETKSKRSGAYSTGAVKGEHPYVLLNWSSTLNDVFTLAHEMGHNMHSWYSANNQPYTYADYPIFLAEVASITNEALLLKYLIEHAESKDEKLSLIETALNNIQATFYRQTRFAEFEMKVQSQIEDGIPMTPDKISNLFGELFQKYWGPDMVTDVEEKYSWPRIHHFYYNFYVYQYATSLCAAEALAQKIFTEGKPAVDSYLAFLKSGRSEYAIPTLKKAGVDMSTSEPIVAVVKKANALLDQLEKLLNE